jgi:hypothetical protein
LDLGRVVVDQHEADCAHVLGVVGIDVAEGLG